jgi:hypothetical protein
MISTIYCVYLSRILTGTFDGLHGVSSPFQSIMPQMTRIFLFDYQEQTKNAQCIALFSLLHCDFLEPAPWGPETHRYLSLR